TVDGAVPWATDGYTGDPEGNVIAVLRPHFKKGKLSGITFEVHEKVLVAVRKKGVLGLYESRSVTRRRAEPRPEAWGPCPYEDDEHGDLNALNRVQPDVP